MEVGAYNDGFCYHLPHTSWKHDAVWVIVDRLTKSAHFLAIQMTPNWRNSVGCTSERLFGYMECQSLSYRTRIPGLWLTFRRVSKNPWGHS